MNGFPAVWLFLSASVALAQSDFAQHPAVTTVSTCKELDFNSYFRAQDHRKHLIRDNPDRSKPNFGGKYLLLKQELMMETLWLIADCETGKFHRETLTGLLEFKPDSLLVILTKPKSNDLPQYQLWRGDEWTRLDTPTEAPAKTAAPSPVPASPGASIAPAASPAASAAKPEEVYAGMFRKYPETPVETCKDLDYNSYFRAQNFKNNLIKLNPERTKPNFAGKYLLLKNDVLFERFWLIADCTTGKFINQIVKGSVEFRPDSALLIVRHSSEYPRLSVWRDQRFVDLLNPVRTGRQEIENEIFDQDARDLMTAAGIAKGDTKVEFEDLRCIGTACTIRKYPDPKPQPLTTEQARLAEAVLKKWGAELQDSGVTGYSIESGKCNRQKSYPACQIRLTR